MAPPRPGPSALTYRSDPGKWTAQGDRVRLSAAGRGQEFILDADDYPVALDWTTSIIGLADSE